MVFWGGWREVGKVKGVAGEEGKKVERECEKERRKEVGKEKREGRMERGRE